MAQAARPTQAERAPRRLLVLCERREARVSERPVAGRRAEAEVAAVEGHAHGLAVLEAQRRRKWPRHAAKRHAKIGPVDREGRLALVDVDAAADDVALLPALRAAVGLGGAGRPRAAAAAVEAPGVRVVADAVARAVVGPKVRARPADLDDAVRAELDLVVPAPGRHRLAAGDGHGTELGPPLDGAGCEAVRFFELMNTGISARRAAARSSRSRGAIAKRAR